MTGLSSCEELESSSKADRWPLIEIRRPEHPLPLKRSGVRQVHRATEESRELGDTIREKESAGMKCGVAGSGLASDTLEHRGRKLRYIGILGE